MMMVQTSLMTTVKSTPGLSPSAALARVNETVFENIQRMKAKCFMTIMALRVEPDRVVYAGQHQDLLVWRNRTREVETITTNGTWLGLEPSIEGALVDAELALAPGDVLLLFTDGVTEADDASGAMFGVERLAAAFGAHADGEVGTLVKVLGTAAMSHSCVQEDDITVVALKRRA